MQNLIHLPDFSTDSIINALHVRYDQDQIYTDIGSILVALNPYKILDIYTHEQLSLYVHGREDLPPHVFRVAAGAYRGLCDDRTNQSIVISGESGSGKSETTKLMLQYLSEVAGSENSLEGQMMESNPLLEALGNAKTVRNNNSSRFGKWMQVHFHPHTHSILGCDLTNYLLEKTRVIRQSPQERNYHIFYQFCEGASAAVRKEFDVLPVAQFHYLNKGTLVIPGVSDAKDWAATVRSMEQLGFSTDDIKAVQRVLVVVLHTGNLVMQKNAKDLAEVKNKDVIQLVAKHLKVSQSILEQALLTRSVTIQKQTSKIPLTSEQAEQTRDALAKALYGGMFDWIIAKINATLKPREKATNTIGVLDIFGFEVFQANSLEQCFINYANEKLQQHFNKFIFKTEQAEYKEEGLPMNAVTFVDNVQVVELIDGKGGILRMIDEEGVVPGGNDEALLGKFVKTHGKHAHFSIIQKRPEVFVIKHYAGQVVYSIAGFVEKNRDKVGDDIINMVSASSDALFASLLRMDGSRKNTLSVGFQQSLEKLGATLAATAPHFVRCVKPNNEKIPDFFVKDIVFEQMKNTGLFQAIEVRKSGYAYRRLHKDFAHRYHCLIPKGTKTSTSSSAKSLCEVIKNNLIKTYPKDLFEELQIAKTKVFYREPQDSALTKLRAEGLQLVVLRLQRFLRMCQAKGIVRRRREVMKRCQAALKSQDPKAALAAIEFAEANDVNFAAVKQLQTLLNVTKQAEELTANLSRFMNGSIDKLEVSVSQARQFLFNYESKSLLAAVLKAEEKIAAEMAKQREAEEKRAREVAAREAAELEERERREGERRIQEIEEREKEAAAARRPPSLPLGRIGRPPPSRGRTGPEMGRPESLSVSPMVPPPITNRAPPPLRGPPPVRRAVSDEKGDDEKTSDETISSSPSSLSLSPSPPSRRAPPPRGQGAPSSRGPPPPPSFDRVASSSSFVSAPPSLDRVPSSSALPPPFDRSPSANSLPPSPSASSLPLSPSASSLPPPPASEEAVRSPLANTCSKVIAMSQLIKGQYPLSSFSGLRSKADYGKGLHLDKTQQMKSMLVWQKTPILRSLTQPAATHRGQSTHAISIFKNILGFMTDFYHPYPVSLGLEVLSVGFKEPAYRDEVYCQIVKQTTNNPNVGSSGYLLGWVLLYCCLRCFPPSVKLGNVVVDHIAQAAHPTYRAPHTLRFQNTLDLASLCFIAFTVGTQPGQTFALPTQEELAAIVNFSGTGDEVEALIGSWVTQRQVFAPEVIEMKVKPKRRKGEFYELYTRRRRVRAPTTHFVTIGVPQNVQKVVSLSYDPEHGFNFEHVPDSWKAIFRDAGIKKKDLQDKDTAARIYGVIQSSASRFSVAGPPPNGNENVPDAPSFDIPDAPSFDIPDAPPPPDAPSDIPAPDAPPPSFLGRGPPSRGPPRASAAPQASLLDSIRAGAILKKVADAPPLGDGLAVEKVVTGALIDRLQVLVQARTAAIHGEESDDDWSDDEDFA